MKMISLIILLVLSSTIWAQYHPPVGTSGTSAIKADSSVIIEWASGCTIDLGWIRIDDTLAGKPTFGSFADALGPADITVVSLGDGGIATLEFATPIANGPGWDFAVFENSFSDEYLELAFVEVSSNGVDFYRFPSHSLSDTSIQVGSFGILDATEINNLAGKYRGGYGVPFDLAELVNVAGLDVNAIVKVRVVDVVGSILPQYGTTDTAGNMINDPWPTPFESSGFDLDGVGVIHNQTNVGIVEIENTIFCYPNPTNGIININIEPEVKIDIFSLSGEIVSSIENSGTVDLSWLSPGVYILKINAQQGYKQALKLIIVD